MASCSSSFQLDEFNFVYVEKEIKKVSKNVRKPSLRVSFTLYNIRVVMKIKQFRSTC